MGTPIQGARPIGEILIEVFAALPEPQPPPSAELDRSVYALTDEELDQIARRADWNEEVYR